MVFTLSTFKLPNRTHDKKRNQYIIFLTRDKRKDLHMTNISKNFLNVTKLIKLNFRNPSRFVFKSSKLEKLQYYILKAFSLKQLRLSSRNYSPMIFERKTNSLKHLIDLSHSFFQMKNLQWPKLQVLLSTRWQCHKNIT